MIPIPSRSLLTFHHAAVFCDFELRVGECRFELPSAGWFDLYSRTRDYLLIVREHEKGTYDNTRKMRAIKAEVKASLKTPTIYINRTEYRRFGFDLDGDVASVFEVVKEENHDTDN